MAAVKAAVALPLWRRLNGQSASVSITLHLCLVPHANIKFPYLAILLFSMFADLFNGLEQFNTHWSW